MGIIKQILNEAVVKSRGWVDLFKLINDNGYGDLLLPHKIVNDKYIQYDLSKYKEIENYRGYDNFDQLDEFTNNFLSSSSYKFLLQNNILLYAKVGDWSKSKCYIWFKMDLDLNANVIGSGYYNYAHNIKNNKIRKSPTNPTNDNYTLSPLLPYLSQEYPQLFIHTIAGKNGALIQDKVTLPDKKIIDVVDVIGYHNVRDTIDNGGNLSDFYEEINNMVSGDIDLYNKVVKFLHDYYDLYLSIMETLGRDDVVMNYITNKGSYYDLHEHNVGYDKDGELKAFDI